MTAIAPAADRERPDGAATGCVPWQRLIWVTWRQYRAALTWGLAVVGLTAAVLALEVARHGRLETFRPANLAIQLGNASPLILMQLLPVLAGMFLGAPLLARETENGTCWLAWTQSASRSRWLLARVIPGAAALVLAGTGLGAEFGWWLSHSHRVDWQPLLFDLKPLPFASWTLFAFGFGVFAGEVIRQTVPAMAATLAGYSALLYQVSVSWREHYLPPLHRAVRLILPDGYNVAIPWGTAPGPDILSTSFRWPDGRLLSGAQQGNSWPWLVHHHIVLWTTYQPASRYVLFQWMEAGWLAALSALLMAAAAVLIRRRAA